MAMKPKYAPCASIMQYEKEAVTQQIYIYESAHAYLLSGAPFSLYFSHLSAKKYYLIWF
jgi:hypothetical protein